MPNRLQKHNQSPYEHIKVLSREQLNKLLDDQKFNSTHLSKIPLHLLEDKEILIKLLKLINKKRILIPLFLPIANLSAKFFQLFPSPLLTVDQLKLLKYDNVSSGNYQTNFDIGVPSTRKFDEEVKKYCYMWKDGGQFSTEKYNSLENN